MRGTTPCETKRKSRMSSKERRAARKAARNRKRKKSESNSLTGIPDGDWDSVASSDDIFEMYKATFLHNLDVMYGFQFGIDLDEFVTTIDPLKQFHFMKELTTTDLIGPRFPACTLQL